MQSMSLRERVERVERGAGILESPRDQLLKELIAQLPSDLLRLLAELARETQSQDLDLGRMIPRLLEHDPRWAAFCA